MTLTHLDKQIEAIRAEAGKQRNAYNDHRQFLQNHPNLTPAGREAELAPLEKDFRESMQALMAQETTLVANAVRDLERRVFGTVGTSPDAVIMFRDAQERAARLETIEEARDAMRRAILSQDTVLCQAILGRALEQGWRPVIDAYTEQNTPVADAISDLATLTRFQRDDTQRLRASMIYL